MERATTIKALPPSFSKLRHLKVLYLNGVELAEFPPCLKDMPALQVIDFSSHVNYDREVATSNYVPTIPEWVCQLPALKYLNVAVNALTTIPAFLARLKANINLWGNCWDKVTWALLVDCGFKFWRPDGELAEYEDTYEIESWENPECMKKLRERLMGNII